MKGIFFKEVFARFYSLRQYVFCMYMCIVVAYDCTIQYQSSEPLHFRTVKLSIWMKAKWWQYQDKMANIFFLMVKLNVEKDLCYLIYLHSKPQRSCVCPPGVMVKATGLPNRSKRVRTPVALLHSPSAKYPWERYEPPYPLNYGLNSTTPFLLGELLWH